MSKILILNGPPSSGKDIAKSAICSALTDVAHHQFKEQIYKQVQLFYMLTDDQIYYLYFGPESRKIKEIPHAWLNGRSPRGALIHMSEIVTKPNFGANYYGNTCAKYTEPKIVFSDGGFPKELGVIVDTHGFDNVAVCRIYRAGYTFAGDSREYFENGLTGHYFDITNFMPDTDNEVEYQDFLKRMIIIGKNWFE